MREESFGPEGSGTSSACSELAAVAGGDAGRTGGLAAAPDETSSGASAGIAGMTARPLALVRRVERRVGCWTCAIVDGVGEEDRERECRSGLRACSRRRPASSGRG